MVSDFRHVHEVAAVIDVPYCDGFDAEGRSCGNGLASEMEHRRGFVRNGVVHLSDRRVTRSAIKQFALLVADAIIGSEVAEIPAWKARWLRCSIAAEICRRKIHVRIPAAYWNLDRWTVRAQAAQVVPGTPQRAEATAWAQAARPRLVAGGGRRGRNDPMSQRELEQALRYQIDQSYYTTNAHTLMVKQLIEANPISARSNHVLYNLGATRLAWLRERGLL